MRQIILLLAASTAIYLAWVVPVSGVSCTVNSDCYSIVVCSAGNDFTICQHQDHTNITANGGLCTCKAGACAVQTDCHGDSTDLDCDDSVRHCYDGTCICDRFPIGRK